MAKVDLTLITSPAKKSLIEHLELLLAEAKSGELQEMCYVGSYQENKVCHGWTSLTNSRRLIGEIEVLKYRMIEAEDVN